jgi:3-isopropylmalate/(R)-2-methylmalate dehydratase large subunit
MSKRNIIQKIWDQHIVKQNPGHPSIFAIDYMLIHEVTSAQAFDVLRERGLQVWNRDRFLATLDHSIPTRQDRLVIYDPAAKAQVTALRNNCQEFGVPLKDYDQGQGIVHVIGPEFGITQPGMTIVCGDSHTSTHGAFGALAFGIGTSEVGTVLATGCLLQEQPKTMKVEFEGQFQKGVYAKDAILKLISLIGIGGANGHIIEYTGSAVRSMNMAERMTVCNMSIECGARAGLVAPDQVTFDYIQNKPYAPKGSDWDRAVKYWSSLQTDEGASYDLEIKIDVNKLEAMLTWGTNPGQGLEINQKLPLLTELPEADRTSAKQAYEYINLVPGTPILDTKIDWAFLGSCTNGRIEDLRIAAEILKNHKVADGVTFYIVPGSEAVRKQAIDEGLDLIFKKAGAEMRMPGCSMCLGMNDDKVPAGMRCISSSNRNFVGRQGPGSRTHLASPATVAASAVAGRIVSARGYL